VIEKSRTNIFYSHDVIIVGAGLIGAAFALSLAKRRGDLRILLVERTAQIETNPRPNQRVLALGKLATDMLEDISIMSQLDERNCYPYEHMFVWDSKSDGKLTFDAKDYSQEQLGMMIDGISLTQLLQRSLQNKPNISAYYDLDINEMEIDTTQARLNTSAGDFSAPLIVAADGAQSWCRRKAKIFAHHRAYNQQGIVARIRTEHSHEDTAWQVFMPGGPLGLLPLHDNQCSIVWSADNAKADELMALADKPFAKAMQKALDGKLGNVELLSKRQKFPLQSIKAETYFKRRLVLIGDAAHSIHPLAGQGANLGFKDIAALVAVLENIEAENLGDLANLQSYQRARKADNEQTDLMMTSLSRAYQFNHGLWPKLRGSGMNWLSRSPRIKRILAHQAMGLTQAS